MAKAQSKETARIKISEAGKYRKVHCRFSMQRKMLIIEIDGTSHFDEGAKEKDALRESYLRNLGFDVLRFNNTSAAESPGWVAHTISDHLGYNKD